MVHLFIGDEMNKYQAWIDANITNPIGRCHESCIAMQQTFPELKLERGHYICPFWGSREHWWLSLDDLIVDPTAAQFPSKGAGTYIPVDPFAPEPTGLCPECGGYCYDWKQFCCKAHEAATRSYLTSGNL